MPRSTVESRLPGYVAELGSILQDIYDALPAVEHSSSDTDSDGNGDDHEMNTAVADADNTRSYPGPENADQDQSWRSRRRVAPPNENIERWLDNVEDEDDCSESADDSADDADDSSDNESDVISTSHAVARGSDDHAQHDVEHEPDDISAVDHQNATSYGEEELQWHDYDTPDQALPTQDAHVATTNGPAAPVVAPLPAVPASDCRQVPHFHIVHCGRLWNVVMMGAYHRLAIPQSTITYNDPECRHMDAASFVAHYDEINRNGSATPETAVTIGWLNLGLPPPAYRQMDPVVQHEKTLLALQIMSRTSEAHEAQGDNRIFDDHVWPMFEAREGELAALDYTGEMLPVYNEIEWGKYEPPTAYT